MPIDKNNLVRNISNASSDADLIQVAQYVAASDQIEDVCNLAQALAQSGIILGGWQSSLIADIPSTGGPFSLSTLLCPIILAASGCYVPKLGVPGRPAGGIDCMMQVSGYQAEFDESSLRKIIAETGYAHFLSGGRFAPLDARLFSLRQRHGLQSVARLAAASILSKKLAVGVRQVGLDIRVAPWGNFGQDMNGAKVAADIFKNCANMLGINACTFLTDATIPYQPYLGRSESLLAMAKVLDDSAEGLLATHAENCLKMAIEVIAGGDIPTWQSVRSALTQHLKAQGSDFQHFEDVAAQAEAGHTRLVVAPHSGYFFPNIPGLRDILVQAQNAYKSVQPTVTFPDPLGLILLATAGEQVEEGQPLASVRANDEVWNQFNRSTESALDVRLD